MPLMLRTLNGPIPPAPGYGFIDPRTKKEYDGMACLPNEMAATIRRDRIMNKHIYSLSEPQWFDISSIVQEIFIQVSGRHPELFQHSDAQIRNEPIQSQEPSQPSTVCVCGEKQATPIYCGTCGGHKLQSWRCVKCGKQRGV